MQAQSLLLSQEPLCPLQQQNKTMIRRMIIQQLLPEPLQKLNPHIVNNSFKNNVQKAVRQMLPAAFVAVHSSYYVMSNFWLHFFEEFFCEAYSRMTGVFIVTKNTPPMLFTDVLSTSMSAERVLPSVSVYFILSFSTLPETSAFSNILCIFS